MFMAKIVWQQLKRSVCNVAIAASSTLVSHSGGPGLNLGWLPGVLTGFHVFPHSLKHTPRHIRYLP
jgi:hypothetical protein